MSTSRIMLSCGDRHIFGEIDLSLQKKPSKKIYIILICHINYSVNIFDNIKFNQFSPYFL